MRFKNLFKRKKRPNFKIGLAFGGGGTRGFAHIGVLKAFEENGIEFDEVSGTSIGSVVASAYAYGLSSDEMLQYAKQLKTSDIRNSKLFFIPSKTDGIETFVKNMIGDATFDDLKKPTTIVAVDLITGQEVHITKGSVVKACAGSCAVPMIFNPVEFENYRLVDGGLQNNIPADVLRQNGCKIVISIDINPTRGLGTNGTSPKDIIVASIGIMMKSNAVKGYMFSDLTIKADTSKFKSTRLDGSDEMYQIGYEAAIKAMPKIKQLLMPKKKFSLRDLFSKNKKNILKDEKKDDIDD